MNLLQLGFLLLLFGVTLALVRISFIIYRSALTRDGSLSPQLSRLVFGRKQDSVLPPGGNWAFYLHRITGIGIALFLPLHIIDIAVYAFLPSRFDDLHQVYGTVYMRFFECGLLFALLFHAFNGIRIIAVDYFNIGYKTSLNSLRWLTGVVLVLSALGSIVILRPVL